MISVSEKFRQTMQERTDFLCGAKIYFADGRVMELDESAFAVQGNTVTDAAAANALPLGAAISRSIQIELVNDDDRFADYVFLGAAIQFSLKFNLEGGDEIVPLGEFTVTTPESYGNTIIITANDAMYKADKEYSTALTYPATLSEMLQEACENCGITLSSSEFRNYEFTVAAAPPTGYTYRQIIGYIAMLAAGNARINRSGALEIITYDFSFLGVEHDLKDWSALKVEADDIVITGLQTAQLSGNKITAGAEGYVLNLENPLLSGKEQAALESIGEVLINAAFRNFEGDYIAYPLAEFMDPVKITDKKGNIYYSVLTDIEFEFFGFTSFANSGESALRSGSSYSQPETKAIIASRQFIANAPGLFSTTASQGGNNIIYLHDKMKLDDSSVVIKLEESALSVSSDGGDSYIFTGTFNPSDYISEKNSVAVTGESGSVCVWSTRRWASGDIELYGLVDFGPLEFAANTAGTFEALTPEIINFPETLPTELPNVQITPITTGCIFYGFEEELNAEYLPQIELLSFDEGEKVVKLAVYISASQTITEV